MRNLYRDLGIGPSATPPEIRSAHRREALRWHPDRADGNALQFRIVQVAWETLGDEGSRTEYDRKRNAWAREQGVVLCPGCAAANALPRRPTHKEKCLCSSCSSPLPVNADSVIQLQQQRLIAEANRVVSEVGAEAAQALIDVTKAGIGRLRRKLTGGR